RRVASTSNPRLTESTARIPELSIRLRRLAALTACSSEPDGCCTTRRHRGLAVVDARDVAAAMPAAMDAAFGPSAPSPGCTRIDSGAPGWPGSVSRAVTVSRSQTRLGAWFGAWFGIWLRALVLNVTNR